MMERTRETPGRTSRQRTGDGAASVTFPIHGDRRRLLYTFLVLLTPWITISCFDKTSTRDPLRIPWETPWKPVVGIDVVRPSSGGSRPSGPHPGTSPPEAAHAVAATCLAAGCHDGMADSPRIHARVALRSCGVCHVPVGKLADHTFRPVAADGGVCRSCHPSHGKEALVHTPFREARCLACHDPHGGSAKALLADEDQARMCGKCHESRRDSVLHGPYADGDCLTCHEPHESGFKALARGPPADLCMGCHDRELEAVDGRRVVADVATLIRSSPFKHGPIREGKCESCHDAHASPHPNLLRKAYPADFYQAYAESHYALCFECHESALALRERTTTLTKFRDGDLNLHYLHVNKKKGRSCRACHEIHASSQPFHLRESVPFGDWILPIDFRRTETGGACLSGCHQLTEYDNTGDRP